MRKACIQCAIKHLAQAEILLTEAALGYPDHYFLAIGHLAEAESEVLGISVVSSSEIRTARLGLEDETPLPYEDLLGMLKSLLEQSTTTKTDPDAHRKQRKLEAIRKESTL